jgi:hypothetical protein
MKFYIVENKEMPWGDYGDALCYGYLNQMDEDCLNKLEIPELKRTGAYIPPLYIANSVAVLAIETIKNALISSEIKGINKCVKVVKKHIVEINWQEWDFNKDPFFYPESGEPEDYIFSGEHNEVLAQSMPEVFSFEIEKRHCLKLTSDICDYKNHTDKALESGEIDLDIFYPTNMLYVIVSEKVKTILEKHGVDTVRFIEIQQVV